MTTLGLIGSGHIGSQLARLAVRNGFEVVLSNSRGPDTLTGLVSELGPRARAATASEAARAADIAVVTIPFKNIGQVPVDELAGKIVIDTNNYYPRRDGAIPELESEETTNSELLQAHLPTSRVVKALNHLYARDLTGDSLPAGAPNRRALAIAGDDAEAKTEVTRLIDAFGFDVVDAGPLAEGWRYQRDEPAYIARLDKDGLVWALRNAKRYREM